MEMISQEEWGSSKVYDDGTLPGRWNPELIVIHWGGNTREIGNRLLAQAQLRGWQRYHIYSRGWRDIAYNYAIDELGNMYRLRGENSSGATSGRDVDGVRWNEKAVNIVWIGGKADADGPSNAAKATLARYAVERGMEVIGHVETGKATQCPGQDWLNFIHDMGEIQDKVTQGVHMLIEKGHPVGATVEKIQKGLIKWDPDALPRWGADGDFGGETETWVREYQGEQGLPVTGKVDDETAYLLS